MIDTRVVLRAFTGKVTFYVRVFERKDRFKGESTLVTKMDYDFKSETPNFFKDQTLLLKGKDIREFCKNEKCGMHVAVYS